jgi:hypothetical protein
MTETSIAITRALRLVAQHPNVQHIAEPKEDTRTGQIAVALDIQLDLPSRWLVAGQSPNGVRVVEPALFSFPADYPLRAPVISLRMDFDRSLAHVNPGSPSEPPRPCIFDGNLDELLQRAGIVEIVNQLVSWLHNAALGRLIDPKQGWEPVRRDSLSDLIVVDSDSMRTMVDRNGGHGFFRLEYARIPGGSLGRGDYSPIIGSVGDRIALNRSTSRRTFSKRLFDKPTVELGSSIALFVWPGKHGDGSAWMSDKYRPETVIDRETLFVRASELGCDKSLKSAMDWMVRSLSGVGDQFAFPVAVVLCARRPFHLIGSDSPQELCPYILEIRSASSSIIVDSLVRPTGFRDAISVQLLRRLSGIKLLSETRRWVQIGAGSIGSKIALHLARSGCAPEKLIDIGVLSPHNMARHALYPTVGRIGEACLQSKAEAVAEVITRLDQKCEPAFLDVRDVLSDETQRKHLFPRSSWAVVNCTASLAVREALASSKNFPSRVIECSLFSSGRIGIILMEGPQRNPDCGDLISAFYQLALDDSNLRHLLFETIDSVQRVEVGQGCGSPTMTIPDGRLSMFAASMAEAIRLYQGKGLPSTGLALVGCLNQDEIGISWRQFAFPPSRVVRDRRGQSHTLVRISSSVHERILAEVSRWSKVETGGILLGRFSEAAQAFYVVDLLAAPEDSKRSVTKFVLGTRGVRKALRSYSESSNNTLYSLGTWHSHLSASDPSARDFETAGAIEFSRLTPSLVLVRTPDDYRLALANEVTYGNR